MNIKIGLSVGVLSVIPMLFAFSPPASAWGRFGVSMGGPIGVHAGTSGVGVSLPTPQASVGTGGPVDVTVAADPGGIRAGASGPYGVSGGVSSDGGAYVGATESLPGGASVSGRADQNGVSGDAGVYIPVENGYYGGI